MSGTHGGIGADRFRQPAVALQGRIGVNHESHHLDLSSMMDYRRDSVAALCGSANLGDSDSSPDGLFRSKERRRR